MPSQHLQPWYRELWPWLLIAGPFAVVIASGVTFWLAYSGRDPLVVDDYYKAGKAINMTLQRDSYARTLGLNAQLSTDNGHVWLVVHSNADAPLAPILRLLAIHPTQANKDRTVLLMRSGAGLYHGLLSTLEPSRYRLTLEDIERTWRLTSEWHVSTGHAALEMRPIQ